MLLFSLHGDCWDFVQCSALPCLIANVTVKLCFHTAKRTHREREANVASVESLIAKVEKRTSVSITRKRLRVRATELERAARQKGGTSTRFCTDYESLAEGRGNWHNDFSKGRGEGGGTDTMIIVNVSKLSSLFTLYKLDVCTWLVCFSFRSGYLYIWVEVCLFVCLFVVLFVCYLFCRRK